MMSNPCNGAHPAIRGRGSVKSRRENRAGIVREKKAVASSRIREFLFE
jgi:hypothetical protein